MAFVACQVCGFLWILYNIFQVEYDILNDIDFDGGNIILFKVVLIRSGGGDSEVLNKVGDITMGHIIEFLEGKEELEVVSIA